MQRGGATLEGTGCPQRVRTPWPRRVNTPRGANRLVSLPARRRRRCRVSVPAGVFALLQVATSVVHSRPSASGSGTTGQSEIRRPAFLGSSRCGRRFLELVTPLQERSFFHVLSIEERVVAHRSPSAACGLLRRSSIVRLCKFSALFFFSLCVFLIERERESTVGSVATLRSARWSRSKEPFDMWA